MGADCLSCPHTRRTADEPGLPALERPGVNQGRRANLYLKSEALRMSLARLHDSFFTSSEEHLNPQEALVRHCG